VKKAEGLKLKAESMAGLQDLCASDDVAAIRLTNSRIDTTHYYNAVTSTLRTSTHQHFIYENISSKSLAPPRRLH
jgi:hypothetical protein